MKRSLRCGPGQGSLALWLSRAWPKKYLVDETNTKTPTDNSTTTPYLARSIPPNIAFFVSASARVRTPQFENRILNSTLMVIARVASFFSSDTPNLADDGRKGSYPSTQSGVQYATPAVAPVVEMAEVEVDEEAARPPYLHVGAPYNISPRFGRLLTAGYRQCWQEELAAQPETCSCTPSTRSRPGSRATPTCHPNTHP